MRLSVRDFRFRSVANNTFKYFSTIRYKSASSADNLCKCLNITKSNADYMCLKYPVINKLDGVKIQNVVNTIQELGFHRKSLIDQPLLFSILPITLKFRYQVLKECGIEKISTTHILSYLPIVKQKTIKELKENGEISKFINIENRLASYMTQWPTSLTAEIYGDVDKCTLFELRLKIIQRYLELVIDLTKDEFDRAMATYPTTRHRPLEVINDTLSILQADIMMPSEKIKANMYLVHADPENLKHIIYNFRSIGGIDIKEVLRMHPKIANKNYSALMEIRKILQDFKISNEAQTKCFSIYTLGPSTVRERLEDAKKIPELQAFFNHPRFLKIIHYKKTAMKRLAMLYKKNKKCLSLNVLSSSSAHYEAFAKTPGDRLGKGRDLVFCVTQSLGKKFKSKDVHNRLKRHPFWINIPIVQIKYVYQHLTDEFTPNDIFHNCPILLYPWSKIKETLKIIKAEQNEKFFQEQQLDIKKLSDSQKLSLTLYILEKKHYFSGNGVWSDDQQKNYIEVKNESKSMKI